MLEILGLDFAMAIASSPVASRTVLLTPVGCVIKLLILARITDTISDLP